MKTILLFVMAVSLTACSSMNNTERAATIGAAAGAAIGGLIGKKAADKPVTGVIVGAAAGGTVGAIIGRQMDKQAKELEEALAEEAKVERVGEGILVTFDSAILFAVNSSDLSKDSQDALSKLGQSLADYEQTEIVVAGHTDSSGAEDYNQKLSERRAQAAAQFLMAQGIPAPRLSIAGYGESQPVASNETVEGRSQNRRVEIAIYATEAYKTELETQQKN
jgi:outer membrane protein OmpA-like peptidoglycan-associated protein